MLPTCLIYIGIRDLGTSPLNNECCHFEWLTECKGVRDAELDEGNQHLVVLEAQVEAKALVKLQDMESYME